MLSPGQRTQRASIAALTRWSREDPAAGAVRGQAGLLAKFERQVDPRGELTPTERQRRAVCARRAHMQRLAFDREKNRRARKAASPDDDRGVA